MIQYKSNYIRRLSVAFFNLCLSLLPNWSKCRVCIFVFPRGFRNIWEYTFLYFLDTLVKFYVIYRPLVRSG